MDPIEDAHNRGLLIYGHEDFITEALKHHRNWSVVSLRLARTEYHNPDHWDNLMLERQIEDRRD